MLASDFCRINKDNQTLEEKKLIPEFERFSNNQYGESIIRYL